MTLQQEEMVNLWGFFVNSDLVGSRSLRYRSPMKLQIAREAFGAMQGYLKENPSEVMRSVRNAFGLRFGVPIDGLRWLARQAERSGKVEDIRLDSIPPGIRVGANFALMKTPLRGNANIYVERVDFGEESLILGLRFEEVELKLNGDAQSPVAALIKSGALDLSNPGNLIGFLPNRPAIITDARGNRVELDLMRDPKLAKNPLVRRAVALLSSLVTLHGVETDVEHLDVSLRALPTGVSGAVRAVKRHLIHPAVGRVLP